LWLAFTLSIRRDKLVGAAVMGLAISGMHYLGMASMTFAPSQTAHAIAAPAIDTSLLAIIISLATFLIFGLALLSALPDSVKTSQSECPTDEGAAASVLPIDETPIPLNGEAMAPRLVKLPVVKDNKKVLIDLDRVESIQANAHYTTVFADRETFFCDLSLSDLERRLDPAQFVRVHRSHMVNVHFAKAFERHNEQAVLVVGGTEERRVPVSRGKMRLLRDPLGI